MSVADCTIDEALGGLFVLECVVVKYETLLTLSGRVEYVRKQHISFSVYQDGQHNTTSYLYKSGHNPVIAVVISISYINQFDLLPQ